MAVALLFQASPFMLDVARAHDVVDTKSPGVGRIFSDKTRSLPVTVQDWLSSRAKVTDDWISRHTDHVDWIVGWWHDYVNSDGSARAWRPDNRPSDADVSDAARKVREGWTFMFRTRHIEVVRDAAWLYRATGDERYARWVVSQLAFYSNHYAQWPLQRRLGVSRLMGQSLDEANVIIQLAQAARAVRSHATPADWTLWRTALFIPVADTLRQSVTGINNISVWQRSALGVIALLLDDSVMWRDAVDGPTGFKALINQGLTRDGIWYEGSFGYNAYLIRATLPLLSAAAETDHRAELDATTQLLRKALITPLTLRFDDGTLPNPSDSIGRHKVPDLPLLAETRTIFPTPWGDAASIRHPGWADVWAPPSYRLGTALPALPEVRSVVLSDTSMALLKNSQEGWQVFSHWGQRTQHHAQREALNLEIHWRGRPVSLDPGTVFYGSSLHGSYYTQPAAHNVPFVNELGQQGWDKGEILRYQATPPSLTVSQPRYAPDVSVDRTTALTGSALHDNIYFRPRPGTRPPRSIGIAWHFDCPLTGDDGLLPFPAILPEGEGFRHWTDVRSYRANDKITLKLHCQSGSLELSITAVGPFEIFKAHSPNFPPGTFRDAIYLRASFSQKGIESTFFPL